MIDEFLLSIRGLSGGLVCILFACIVSYMQSGLKEEKGGGRKIKFLLLGLEKGKGRENNFLRLV